MKLRYIVLIHVLAIILGLAIGYRIAEGKYSQNLKPPFIEQPVSGNVVTHTITKIKYVERIVTVNVQNDTQSQIKEDMIANIGKQDFIVCVNGEDYQFTKSNTERFMFEKNQLQLDQENKIGIDVKIKPVDLTKHCGIGIGFGSSGCAVIITGQAWGPLDWWASGQISNISGGIIVRF